MKNTYTYYSFMALLFVLALQHTMPALTQTLPDSTETYIRNTLLEIGCNADDVNLLIITEGGAMPAAMDYMNGILYISSNYLARFQTEKNGHQIVQAILAHEMGHYYQLGYKLIGHNYALQAENILYPCQAFAIIHKAYKIALPLSITSIGMRILNKSNAHAYEFDADEYAAKQLGSSEPMIRALLSLRKEINAQGTVRSFSDQQIKVQQNQPAVRLSQTSEERAKAQEVAQEKVKKLTARIKPIGEWIERASKNCTAQKIAKTCYAPFSLIRKVLKGHPTYTDRINKLIAYHEENFDTPLPNDLYEEIADMGTPDYAGERILRKAYRSIHTMSAISGRFALAMLSLFIYEKAYNSYQSDVYVTLSL